jgi:hypothetical protein
LGKWGWSNVDHCLEFRKIENYSIVASDGPPTHGIMGHDNQPKTGGCKEGEGGGEKQT